MKLLNYSSIIFVIIAGACIAGCSKKATPAPTTDAKINVKDEAGNNVQGASVIFYYNGYPIGPAKMTDANGNVLFTDLNHVAVYPGWIAEKGCRSSRNNDLQYITLIPHTLNEFNCIIHDVGTAKIVLRGTGLYNIICPVYTGTFPAPDSFYLKPNAGAFSFHADLAGVPGTTLDTIVQITCGDTTRIAVL